MAADGLLLRAEQLYVELGQSAPEIAAALGVGRRTVYDWRDKYDWDLKRSQWVHKTARARTESALDTHREQARANVLTSIRRRELLRQFAENEKHETRDRIAAIKLDATLDPAGTATPTPVGERDKPLTDGEAIQRYRDELG